MISLLATPAVAKPFGWPAAYQLYVLIGLAWAVSLVSFKLNAQQLADTASLV